MQYYIAHMELIFGIEITFLDWSADLLYSNSSYKGSMAIFEVFGCFGIVKCQTGCFKQLVVMYLNEIYPTVPHLSRSDLAFRFYDQKTVKNSHYIWDAHQYFNHKRPYISKSSGCRLLESI